MARFAGPALPDFPWDHLRPYRDRALAHPDGVVDLSIGTPVDPTPDIVRRALAAAADAPGYPTTHGTAVLRTAATDWLARRFGIDGLDPDAVLPTVGSKELVAWLPSLLGVGAGGVVVHPELAYPTYDVGARIAGARPVAADDLADVPGDVDLVWLNSPANPHGRIRSVPETAALVAAARERGALVVSDECYLEFGWEDTPVSVLDPRVHGGSLAGLLAVHSLSKRSNLAGYRAGFVTGDPAVVRTLLEIRKHAGMIVPAPVQAAAAAALDDDTHVDEQRSRYARRRALLRPALEQAGLRVEHSEGGLYLWATRDEDCWTTVGWFAARGIVVGPGSFYGPAGDRHVRVAVTATDDAVRAGANRLRT